MDGAQAAQDGVRLTPMMQQYHALKREAGRALLFYRMGDFYELFHEDAVLAARILDITLTRRGQQGGEDVPMCGVPFHSYEGYLERLIRAGHSVAICEQTENPAEAKKRGAKALVRREIVRVVTPGTLTEDTLLEARAHNHLAALVRLGAGMAVAYADLSTGDLHTEEVEEAALRHVLARIAPSELLLAEGEEALAEAAELSSRAAVTYLHASLFRSAGGEARLKDLFGLATLDGLGRFSAPALAALGALLGYLDLTQIGKRPALKPPVLARQGGEMAIDAVTRASLELTRAQDGGRVGSLLHAVDATLTPAGGRLLSRWIGGPLTDIQAIGARQDMVEYLLGDKRLREELRRALGGAPDLSRALSRLSLERGGPRDLAAVKAAMLAARTLAASLHAGDSPPALLKSAMRDLEAGGGEGFSALIGELTRALSGDLPLLSRDGGFIAQGYDPGLDEVRGLKDGARRLIAGLEEDCRQETGIRSLKIKHSKVLGYFIEVSAAQADRMMAPPLSERFRHRQTLANAVRFTTPQLAELDSRIVRAADEALARELDIFAKLCASVEVRRADLSACADALALTDVACGLAHKAEEASLVRPVVEEGTAFDIKGGRHPVVEASLKGGALFVPNDCRLDEEGEARLLIVTGPNMAGKSTFLRQNALIAVLAQAGAFVPAAGARIGVIDRLFSRVGASDDLAAGRSTFMVEMVETAAILNQSSDRSLVILDEVGRGTSTFDGMSIAWAALEHLHDEVRCRGLFATHYHELTRLSETLPRLGNVSMGVREWKDDIVFLHEVVSGPADKSYGVAVARLAGLPPPVIARARAVLAELERQRPSGLLDDLPLFGAAMSRAEPVMDAAPAAPSAVEEALRAIDPDSLSPRDALAALYDLHAVLEGGG